MEGLEKAEKQSMEKMDTKELTAWKNKVLAGETISREEAVRLAETAGLQQLCEAAQEIRKHFCGDGFDICTIINGKSGRCSENCKYCAQSAHFQTSVQEYPLLSTEEIVKEADYNQKRGVLRFSIVTSGKRLTDEEVERVCESFRAVRKQTQIATCASHGLLSYEQFCRLKEAGVSRYHNNLETSRRFFPSICTTHTYDEKIETIRAAKKAGLSVCSGGIMGLGETMEDRIDMAITLRELGIRSIPVNVLNPIPGTPLAGNLPLTEDEVCRIVAVYRFLLPDAAVRLAGGRGLFADKGRRIFESGANAAISGDMLTTSGITIADDMAMLEELGFVPKLSGEDEEKEQM